MDEASGFEYFCGGRVWDINLTWNTEHPDFTPCFQDSVLIYIQCGLLWLIAPFYILHLRGLNSVPLLRTNLFKSKMIVAGVLAGLSLIDLLKGIADYSMHNVDYLAIIISPLIDLLTFILVIFLIYFERLKAFITSGVLFLFFVVLAIGGIIPLQSFILHASQKHYVEDAYAFTKFILYYVAVGVELVLLCFADVIPQELSANEKMVCPETEASFLSRLTYWWINRLVLLGYRKNLEENDIWLPHPEHLTRNSAPLFERAWSKELRKVKKSNRRRTTHPDTQTSPVAFDESTPLLTPRRQTYNEPTPLQSPTRHTYDESSPLLTQNFSSLQPTVEIKQRFYNSPSLYLALMRVFGVDLLQANICKLFADLLIFVGPILQGWLIAYTVDQSMEEWKGYFYAVLFFVTAVLGACLQQRLFILSYSIGLRVKASVISAIYKKALTMSNEARKTTTVGEIVNLMSVDAQRLEDVISYLWLFWSAPLQISLAIYLLHGILGASVFAGLAAMAIMFPINGVIASIQANLQTKQMNLKDQRIKMMNEVLSGIKVLKLYAWEPSFEAKVKDIRRQELDTLRIISYLNAVESFSWTVAPFLVTLATFATYVMTGGVLDSGKAFTSLTLFNILRYPTTVLPMMISYAVTASVSQKRISNFLQTVDLDEGAVTHNKASVHPITVEDGTFAWNTITDDAPTLHNINLEVPAGSLLAVVGPVGVGKSSLISALLGEIKKLSGTMNVSGSVAYVAQQAWIQNMSLKDNILFGEPYNEERYKRVLEACALNPDLDMLPAGDMTEIGEKGINLSGGQKQRVSLARAVYADRDIYLLDDPLSAVDSHVGKHLFEQVIAGPNALLGKKTRVLVTHGVQWMPKVDSIAVMIDGRISESGSYNSLIAHDGPFAQFIRTYLTVEDNDPEIETLKQQMLDQIDSVVNQDNTEVNFHGIRPARRVSTISPRRVSLRSQPSLTEVIGEITEYKKEENVESIDTIDKLIQDEGGEVGSVKWTVFWSYIKALGQIMSFLLILSYLLFEISSVLSSVWLSRWTEDKLLQNASLVNTSAYAQQTDWYLGVYGGLGLLQVVFVLLHSLLTACSSVSASQILHDDMLSSILRSPLLFFDTTPIGRILNRFSRDIETIDNVLPNVFDGWLAMIMGVFATMVVMSYSTPIFLSIVVPIFGIYYFVQRFYVRTSRQLKRIESVTRSPIYSHFSETITGAGTIRAYNVQSRFIAESEQKVDHNLVYYYASVASNRWLGVWLEFLGALIVLAAAMFAVLGRRTISGGLVGLSISYALQVTENLNWMVRMTSDLETDMVSVERVKEYIETPAEASWMIEDTAPEDDWPASGEILFNDYSMRYRPGLDLVIKNISLQVNPAEKIGIVGRTGAGKSSLVLALFRIVEAVEGDIVIDGQPISALGLHQLRSRLTILPQDPILFSGTLRMNIDPFNKFDDAQIWKALENSHLQRFVQSTPTRLEYECGEGGQNLSVGQRQLVCLARCLLRKTKILILDEATAAVDLETDELIQQTLQTEFRDCTVLTIAHRLNTIMDADRVLVLDMGEVSEFDSPTNLLQNKSSKFYSMAKDAGLV